MTYQKKKEILVRENFFDYFTVEILVAACQKNLKN